MPLYEYRCAQCAEVTEVVRKFSDPPLTLCASCGGELIKLISSPAIQFKGSGFYITDYARNGSGSGQSADGNASRSETPAAKSDSTTAKSDSTAAKSDSTAAKSDSTAAASSSTSSKE